MTRPAQEDQAHMTDISIPPEALEAAAKELYEDHPYTDEDDDVIPWEELYMVDKKEHLDSARYACLAMLKAWPGIEVRQMYSVWSSKHGIILPLPAETTNVEV